MKNREDKKIYELVERRVEEDPRATSVIFEDKCISYEELNHQIGLLAHFLSKIIIRPETIVGVCLENNLNLIVSIFGILKAGGVYLPLDPSYPKDRLQYMIEDANPSIILTERSQEHLFSGILCRVILLDDWEQIKTDSSGCFGIIGEEKDKIVPDIKPEHLAYIIYTSGSTGKPKGIMVTHESCLQIARAHKDLYPKDLIALLSGAISFDVSILIIFHVLTSGGTLVLFPQKLNADPEKIMEFIKKYSINFILTVPAFYGLLLQKGESLPFLKSVSLTGENLPGNLVSLHAQLCSNALLYNEYGPTEYAIGTSIAKIYDPFSKKVSAISAGTPLKNTEVFILDEELKLVPVGSKGEICIGGKGLAKGYLNNQTLTEEKFVWITFSEQGPIRIYRTKDLGRFLPNGELEFLGRMDNQIKIRGFRVELGEIEQSICKYPGIREAVVLPIESREGIQRLIAYFSISSEIPYHLGLQHYLSNILPHYMVPNVYVQVDLFPLTPNGKIDRKILTELFKSREISVDATPPESDLEQILLLIWKKLLGLKSIGIHANFFDLGGNSILLASMQTQIKDALHISTSIVQLFQFPTISQLARYLYRNNLKNFERA